MSNHEIMKKEFDAWWYKTTASIRLHYGVLLPTDNLRLEEATKLAFAAWCEATKQAEKDKEV